MPTDPRVEKAEALAREMADAACCSVEQHYHTVRHEDLLPFATRLIEAEEAAVSAHMRQAQEQDEWSHQAATLHRELDTLRSRLHSLEEAAKLAKDALGRHSIVCYFEPNYCREEDQSHRCERCASRAALSSLSSALKER